MIDSIFQCLDFCLRRNELLNFRLILMEIIKLKTMFQDNLRAGKLESPEEAEIQNKTHWILTYLVYEIKTSGFLEVDGQCITEKKCGFYYGCDWKSIYKYLI